MQGAPLGQRLDPARRRIGYARWMLVLFALSTPGFTVLLIGGTWSIASGSEGEWLITALGLLMLWMVFLGLLIVPGIWYLVRMWRDVPALQVDAWGLVWGDDWSRDLAIEWRDIHSITSRPLRSQYYSDRLLLIHPRSAGTMSTLPAVKRWGAWVTAQLYGTPYAIGLGTLRIKPEELVALIRRHFGGSIDLGAIELESGRGGEDEDGR